MINKLVSKIKKMGAPVVVGLDPMLNYVPEFVQKKAFEEYGETGAGVLCPSYQVNLSNTLCLPVLRSVTYC